MDPSSAHTTIGTFDGTNATTRAKSHTRDAPAPRHMPARPAASIKLHAFVLQSTCAHGQAKERWPNCTGHANTRQTRASHCCGTARSAAQPSRLPNYCDRARHLRDPWLHGPHAPQQRYYLSADRMIGWKIYVYRPTGSTERCATEGATNVPPHTTLGQTTSAQST